MHGVDLRPVHFARIGPPAFHATAVGEGSRGRHDPVALVVGFGQIGLAAERGRKTRKDLKLGICGEHGGDPASATVAQIADAMNAVDPNATYKPNAEGNGLDWS